MIGKNVNTNIPLVPDADVVLSWVDTSPHPWRRYFARILDILVNGLMVYFIVLMPLYFLDSGEIAENIESFLSVKIWGRFADVILTIFLSMFVTAAFIGFWGSSLGKWFFGIKILDQRNRPIGYFAALKREIMVWCKGLGFGIPIISFITLAWSADKLAKQGITSWDKDMNIKVVQRSRGIKQTILSIIGVLLIVMMRGMLSGVR